MITPRISARFAAPFMAAAIMANTPPAAAPAPSFQCDLIKEDMAEIYTGISAPENYLSIKIWKRLLNRKADGVIVKQGAVLNNQRQLLEYDRYRIADPVAAGKRPILFRKYMVGAAVRMCTAASSDKIFGKGDSKLRYRLRCLADTDGDGQYDATDFVGKYVRYSVITGKNVTLPMPDKARTMLNAPIELIQDQQVQPKKPALPSYLYSQISVDRLDGDIAELRLSYTVNITQNTNQFRKLAGDRTVDIEMADGKEYTLDNNIIKFTQTEKGWIATLIASSGAPAEIECGGRVIALPRSYTIVTPDQQTVLRR
jgi:hypothetical protein